MVPQSTIRIDKTYLDVITEDERVCIAYALEARWGPVRISAASLLLESLNAVGTPRLPAGSRTRLGVRPLSATPAGLRFRSSGLGFDGLWQDCTAPAQERALGVPGYPSVRWTCIAPGTRVQATLDREPMSGWGYAERLTMECAPWHLPIDTLHWGRFIAGSLSVVWIAWMRRAHSTPDVSLVLVNGAQQHATAIDEHSIRWVGGAVELRAGRVLRSGPFAHGPIAHIAPLVPGMPSDYLRSREHKQASHARLRLEGSNAPLSAEGWAIHETVSFERGLP